jgi:DNA-binding IclR family transcriptional regulator
VRRTWGFLTGHGQALLFLAREPDARLRDLAEALGVTERTAFGIMTDLSDGGYVVKHKEGRRNRYEIQTELPLPEAVARERSVGEVLDVLVGAKKKPRARRSK